MYNALPQWGKITNHLGLEQHGFSVKILAQGEAADPQGELPHAQLQDELQSRRPTHRPGGVVQLQGQKVQKAQLRDGNDTLGRLASVCALSQRQVSSRVRTTSTSHTIGSAYDGGPARSSKLRGSEHVLLWSPRSWCFLL